MFKKRKSPGRTVFTGSSRFPRTMLTSCFAEEVKTNGLEVEGVGSFEPLPVPALPKLLTETSGEAIGCGCWRIVTGSSLPVFGCLTGAAASTDDT